MKKIALALICLLVILSLAACGSTTGTTATTETIATETTDQQTAYTEEFAELRQRVKELESRVIELESSKSADLQTEETSLLAETTEATEIVETTQKAVTSNMLNYLTIQLQSSNYSDWNAVATCEYATTEHLLLLAKKCAALDTSYTSRADWAKTIATNIAVHKATTGAVLKELANSGSYALWNISVQSEHNDESSLIAFAKKCAALDTSYTSRADWAKTIATNITVHKAINANVLKELATSKSSFVVNIAHQKLEYLISDN